MARIRQTVTTKTVNKAGGEAYKLPTKEAFVTNLLTNFYQEDKYYGDNTPELINMTRGLVGSDPQFVAKSAIYARETMHLRTAPVAVLAEMFMRGEAKLARKVIARIATRPDQLKELVAYLNQVDEKLPKRLHQLRKGISDVLNTFDEYQLAKYNGGNSPKLSDLIKLAHPKPKNDAQAQLFKKVLEGNLEVPYTWETQVSEKGNKTDTWSQLIASGKMGYMAMLRNLRNMAEAELSKEHISQVCAIISDKERVLASKQLPFRFYNAYRMLGGTANARPFLQAVSKAIGYSVENIVELPGVTFTTADNSASMSSRLSSKGLASFSDIANLFQAIVAKGCENHIGSVFGSNFKVVNVNPDNDALSIADKYARTDVGHATHAYLIFEYLLKNKIKVDRIVLFSDMQCYNSGWAGNTAESFAEYRKKVNPNCWLHSIDLAGYGTTPVVSDHVNLVAGWSDKVLNFIPKVEAGADSMIKDIEKVVL